MDLTIILLPIIINIIFLLAVLYTVSSRVKGWVNLILNNKVNEGHPSEVMEMIVRNAVSKYIPCAVISFNKDGEILSFSRGAEKIFLTTAEYMKHKKLTELMPSKWHPEHLEWLKTYRETEITHTGSKLLRTGLRASGEEFPVELNFFLDKSIQGLDLFVVVIDDLSDIENAKNEVRRELLEYQEYEKIGRFGGWYWKLSENDIVHITKGFADIFEIDYEDVHTSESLMKLVNIADQRRVTEVVAEAFEKKDGYIVDYRITKRNRSEVMIHNTVIAVKKDDILIAFKGVINEL